MGQGSESKSQTGIFAKALTNVLLRSSQNCSSSTLSIQDIVFKDIELSGCALRVSGVSQDSKTNINLTCAQNTEQSTNLKNDLSTELKNQLEASVGALNANTAKTQTVNNIRAEILNTIDVSTISSCITTAINQQRQTYGKIRVTNCPESDPYVTFSNLSQKIISDQVTRCIQGNSQLLDLSNRLDQAVKNAQTSSAVGLEQTALIIGIIVLLLCSSLSSLYITFQMN